MGYSRHGHVTICAHAHATVSGDFHGDFLEAIRVRGQHGDLGGPQPPAFRTAGPAAAVRRVRAAADLSAGHPDPGVLPAVRVRDGRARHGQQLLLHGPGRVRADRVERVLRVHHAGRCPVRDVREGAGRQVRVGQQDFQQQ